MDIKLEKRIGNKSVYSAFIGGRKVRASTINGELGARKIFCIIEAQNGVAQSPPMAGHMTTTRHGR
jgi:hypothetical protein